LDYLNTGIFYCEKKYNNHDRVNVMPVWCELSEHVMQWLYHLNVVMC